MAARPRECPCFSGERYVACCGPFHEGKPAPSAEALMRSRFAAFAIGLGGYLFDTLAANHPDRAAPRDAAVRELSRAKERQRFLGLTIVHAANDEVLFVARIFERGVDRSFAELSTFVREENAWKYASGTIAARSLLPGDLSTLTRDAFLAIAKGA